MGAYLGEIRSKEKRYGGFFMVAGPATTATRTTSSTPCSARPTSRSPTTAHYSSPAVDKLLVDAQHEANHDKRVALYHDAQKQILDDAPWIFINFAAARPCDPQGSEGLPAEPDADVLRDAERLAREVASSSTTRRAGGNLRGAFFMPAGRRRMP